MQSYALRKRLSKALALVSILFIHETAKADSLVLQKAFESFQSKTASVILFNVPGAFSTLPVAINDQNLIVGEWTDSNHGSHGFIRSSSGGLTTFDAPGAGSGPYLGTQVAAVNQSGYIAGTFIDPNSVLHGYIRDPAGEFTTVDYPGAISVPPYGTSVTSINDDNVIIGSYNPPSANPHAATSVGFTRSAAGAFTSFHFPGSTYTIPASINDDGVISGRYAVTANQNHHAFYRASNGTLTPFEFPASERSSDATSINLSGVAVGIWTGTAETSPAFLGSANGSTESFFVPSASTTQAVQITDSGYVVGNCTIGSANLGFLRNPGGSIATFQVNGEATSPYAINSTLSVTGNFVDSDTGIQGFLMIPQ